MHLRATLSLASTLGTGMDADMLAECEGEDLKVVLARLDHEARFMDHLFRSIEAETSGLALHVPRGLPASHWWFHLTGCSNTPVC